MTFTESACFGGENNEFILKRVNKDGSPDMRYRENREHYLPKFQNKDGSDDLRLLVNRKKKGLHMQ